VSRRWGPGALTALLGLSFLVVGPTRLAGQLPARPPNIIFIMADDLGYGDLGAYGQRRIATPRLDQMAREGMRFTQHYAGAPVCAPSRSVLMTGLHTGHTTVRGNFGADGERVPLAAEDVTVAEVLGAAGYATGIIGKWGLGEPGTPGIPTKQGFDFFYGYLNQRHAHSHFPEFLWRDTVQERHGAAGASDSVFSQESFAYEARRFVERNRDRPFFLYLALTLPHAEIRAPAGDVLPYLDRFPAKEATFAGMVTRFDRDVGMLLDLLSELGLEDNTLVIFTSDNGPHAEDGHDPQFFASSGGLRGVKRDLYEGGIRVPMLARWPGVIEAGAESDHLSGFWDFLATAAEIAGVASVPATDGVSYAATLRGEPQAAPSRLYWEFYEGTPAQAVRFGRWKAIRKPMFGGAIELFDLQSDPYETRDVSGDQPEVVARARDAMAAAHLPSPYWSAASN
jgi:arylsulfatase A